MKASCKRATRHHRVLLSRAHLTMCAVFGQSLLCRHCHNIPDAVFHQGSIQARNLTRAPALQSSQMQAELVELLGLTRELLATRGLTTSSPGGTEESPAQPLSAESNDQLLGPDASPKPVIENNRASRLVGPDKQVAGQVRLTVKRKTFELGPQSKRRREMHPQSKYAGVDPDFEQLAQLYDWLRPYVRAPRRAGGRSWIDWQDFNATRELTRALLLHDFGLNW